jgi:hypothetical protein
MSRRGADSLIGGHEEYMRPEHIHFIICVYTIRSRRHSWAVQVAPVG